MVLEIDLVDRGGLRRSQYHGRRPRRHEEERESEATGERHSGGRGKDAPVGAPHLEAPDGKRRNGAPRSLPIDALQHRVRDAFEIGLLQARGGALPQRLALREQEILAAAAGGALGKMLLEPDEVLFRQLSVEVGADERHRFLATSFHRRSSSPSPSTSSPSSLASSPRYSRSLRCIFSRAWNSLLITVPLRIPSTLASSS